MSTTTTLQDNPELRPQVWETVTRKGGLDEQSVEILLFGIQHGLSSLEAVESAAGLHLLAFGPNWRHPDRVPGPLELAWEADQRAKSVPVICPSWCSGIQGPGEAPGASGRTRG